MPDLLVHEILHPFLPEIYRRVGVIVRQVRSILERQTEHSAPVPNFVPRLRQLT